MTALPDPPRLLNALDDLGVDGRGWWTARCPICTCDGMTISADEARGEWALECPDGCPHEEVVGWLQADVRLWGTQEDEQRTRGWVCMMLAPTVEIWEALLRGDPVAADALDQTWLRKLRATGVINHTFGS